MTFEENTQGWINYLDWFQDEAKQRQIIYNSAMKIWRNVIRPRILQGINAKGGSFGRYKNNGRKINYEDTGRLLQSVNFFIKIVEGKYFVLIDFNPDSRSGNGVSSNTELYDYVAGFPERYGHNGQAIEISEEEALLIVEDVERKRNLKLNEFLRG